jgi:hypothetical protein
MPLHFTGNDTADEYGFENFPRSPLSFHFGAMPFDGYWTMFCKKCDAMWKLEMKEDYTTEELSHFVRHIESNCRDIPRIDNYYLGDEEGV